MSAKTWEKRVLAVPGADKRVAEIESELRVAVGLTALRERAGLSQRAVADRIGVSQPRVAAIERSHNVTLDVLAQYLAAVGASLEVAAVRGRNRTPLLFAYGCEPDAIRELGGSLSAVKLHQSEVSPLGRAAAKKAPRKTTAKAAARANA